MSKLFVGCECVFVRLLACLVVCFVCNLQLNKIKSLSTFQAKIQIQTNVSSYLIFHLVLFLSHNHKLYLCSLFMPFASLFFFICLPSSCDRMHESTLYYDLVLFSSNAIYPRALTNPRNGKTTVHRSVSKIRQKKRNEMIMLLIVGLLKMITH